MPKLFKGEYDHLNAEPVALPLDMDELAKLVVSQNYGTVRLLAAIIRARQQDWHAKEEYPDELRLALEDLLKRGLR